MLNELTPKDGERVALNAYRHAWSIVANIFVYAVTWFLLDDHSSTQMDAHVFRVREVKATVTSFIANDPFIDLDQCDHRHGSIDQPYFSTWLDRDHVDHT